VFAQIQLTQLVLPGMLERGDGTIINITSHVAGADPPGPVGEGGWGFGYAASKAAFHRMAGILHVELGDRGIAAFNVDPGFVVTEMMQIADHGAALDRHYRGAPPSVPASVVAWLASSPDAFERRGTTVRAQKLCLERGLHPDWR
jgi:NAD(P)-dependent dehydrogenase (short-subunit alcohol dehydrogenase family)